MALEHAHGITYHLVLELWIFPAFFQSWPETSAFPAIPPNGRAVPDLCEPHVPQSGDCGSPALFDRAGAHTRYDHSGRCGEARSRDRGKSSYHCHDNVRPARHTL
jgi:hypothetical protein